MGKIVLGGGAASCVIASPFTPQKRGAEMANSKEITMILKGSELERALELDITSLYLRTFVYALSPLEY